VKTYWRVIKYSAGKDVSVDEPDEVLEIEGNILTLGGITTLWNLVTQAGTATPYNSSNAHIGVGNGTTPEDRSQDRLQGTSVAYKPVDSGYPTVQGDTAIWQATFGVNEAAFAWNEAGVANGNNPPTNGVLLNRKVATMGTKPADATWILQVRITLT